MKNAQWIRFHGDTGETVIDFRKKIRLSKKVASAILRASAIGLYVAYINGERVGKRLLTPGFTSYRNRIQYQEYDVTDMMSEDNSISLLVGVGWAVGHMGHVGGQKIFFDHVCAIAELEVRYSDGSSEIFATDSEWDVYSSQIRFAEIYHGETVDMTYSPEHLGKASADGGKYNLIPDVGAPVVEQDILSPARYFVTPSGERVIDFGQNMTGYVTVKIKGRRGERVVLSFAETLDKNGNIYTENYRSARNRMTYVLDGNDNIFKPQFSFQGFRFAKIEEYPNKPFDINEFRAVATHTHMARTGSFVCGDKQINQLFHNIIWGQKSNYLDVPTDCPQRDERLGWTGDAQIFCRTAGTNFDVSAFFKKWLGDLRAEQREDGAVLGTCPELPGICSHPHSRISAGWGDAVTIIPWTLYELYGDKSFLSDNFEMMKRWVEYMHSTGPEEYLWLTGYHYGDWLAMDSSEDSYVGATSNDLIASAFFAHSTKLLIKSGEVLGKDMSHYRKLHSKIVAAFREYFMENGFPKRELPFTEIMLKGKSTAIDTERRGMTQTAITLILKFELCTEEEREPLAAKLEELIWEFGGRMSTGFLGTPYLLHALSENGRTELAYKLLFNESNPSWLYSVNHGATTMWEHWNSLKEDGSFWDTHMNSFNHYAYGAVGDWLYGAVAGIRINDGGAGYSDVTLSPVPCKRLGFVNCSVETVKGRLESNWYYTDGGVRYEFLIPRGCTALVRLPDGFEERLGEGRYEFFSSKEL